jgi:hypothetical protein
MSNLRSSSAERFCGFKACDRVAQGLRAEPLEVHSAVSAEVFRLFRSAVEGEVIEITNADIEGLSAVCNEFGLGSLSQRLRAFKDSPAHQKVRIGALEKRVRRLEADVQALQGSHQTAAAAQAGLESDVRTLKGWAGPRLDSAIVPAYSPIFAPPARPQQLLRPRGRSHPQVLDSPDRIGASVVMCSIHQQHHHKQRSVIDTELSSFHMFLCSSGECPRLPDSGSGSHNRSRSGGGKSASSPSIPDSLTISPVL